MGDDVTPGPNPNPLRARSLAVCTLGVGALLAALSLAGGTAVAGSTPSASPNATPLAGKTPIFAYYYIWFTPTSWNRAKIDLPLLGKYSSDDPQVIAKHVELAQSAGIDGFIVSWKHEPALDRPLQLLVAEATRRRFKLILLYEGLDVNRNPIDANKVASDILWFSQTYGDNPVFNVFGKPAVIWSGTWKFSDQQIAMVRSAIGAPNRLLLLGSERSAADYQRRWSVFDGDAYYWSSADPQSTPGYLRRIEELSATTAAHHALWIAPVVPGFDARLLGGTTVVPRRAGDTYRASWTAVAGLRKSAVGIISWNEFSENSHIEPSVSNGYLYLDTTRKLATGSASVQSASPGKSLDISALGPTDSSELPASFSDLEQKLSIATAVALLIGLAAVVIWMRRRPSRHTGE